MEYAIKKLRIMQERSTQLLRVQQATERAIVGVQAMKTQLVCGRRDKRDREIAFLQARTAPLIECLFDMPALAGTPASTGAASSSGSHGESDEGLRAVVQEALQRRRAAEGKDALASITRLCARTSVQCSACGGKMRVVLHATYRRARLERYAIIVQQDAGSTGSRPTSTAPRAAETSSGDSGGAKRQTTRADASLHAASTRHDACQVDQDGTGGRC